MTASAPGEIIRQRREAKGLTREQLVARIEDLSLSTLIRIELRGGLPRALTLAKIASALDLTVDEILDGATAAAS